MAQRKVPGLQSQLEEYKSALCQLQAQKQRLQTEVGHTVTMTTQGFTLITCSVFLFSMSQYSLKKYVKLETNFISTRREANNTRICSNYSLL